MSIEELQQSLREFRDERDWRRFHTPKDLAASIAIEAGELQESLLWKSASADMEVLEHWCRCTVAGFARKLYTSDMYLSIGFPRGHRRKNVCPRLRFPNQPSLVGSGQ